MVTWPASSVSSSRSRSPPRCAFFSSTLTSASTPEPAGSQLYGLLSDVHSNLEALDAVLAAMPAGAKILVLGDIVGYGPDPNGVIERLRAVRAHAVMGNHDAAVLNPALLDWFNPHAAASSRWTRGTLTLESRRYLAALPTFGKLGRHRLVHGSPRKPYMWEYILEELQALEIILAFGVRYCFFGHTHLPRIFTLQGEQIPEPGDWIALPEAALVNPGSVGQPRDGNPNASFALLDLAGARVQYYRVPYDVATTQAKIREAGLPEVEAMRLALGR